MSEKVEDNLSLEKIINSVDYNKLAEDYVPSSFAIKFINFIKLVNGESGEENKSPLFHYDILDTIYKYNNILAVVFRGGAKALALDTRIMTPTGYTTMKDVQVGDYVLDRNGVATEVTHKSEVFNNQCYKINLTNGESFIANEDHNHIVEYRTVKNNENGKHKNYWKEVVLTTKDLLDKGVVYNRTTSQKQPKSRQLKWYIPLIKKPIEYEYIEPYSIDPYTVGVLLGDGNFYESTKSINVTSSDFDSEELKSYIPYKCSENIRDKRQDHTVHFNISGLGNLYLSKLGSFKREHKEIPYELLHGSINTRLEVLRGLMDTDGTISKEGIPSFVSTSKALAYGVHSIVKSLGGYSTIKKFENDYLGYYTVRFTLQYANPFKLRRKAVRWNPDKNYMHCNRVGIESIEPVEGVVKSQCISVKSNTHSYLIEDSIITHNTTLTAEYLILYIATFGVLDGFGDVTLGMYVGDTMDNGVKNLRNNLEHRYKNSEFLQKFVPEAKFTDPEWEFTNIEGHKLTFRGFGATPLALNTKLYTEYGTTTIGECKVGDKIFDNEGKLCTIVDKSIVFNKPVYRIHLIDGRYLDVTHDHINHVIHKCRNYAKYKDSNFRYEVQNLTTTKLLDIPIRVTGKSEYRLFVPVCKALEYPEVDLGIDPYTLGLLIGDGQLKNDGSCILTAEEKDMKFYKTQIPHVLGVEYPDPRYPHVHQLSIKKVYSAITALGLRGKHSYDKFIPEICFRMSKKQRLSLLQGMMDTDGTVSERLTTYKASYCTTSKQLAEDLQRLVWSLGGYAIINSRKQYEKSFGDKDYFIVSIHLNEYVFRLPRKLSKVKLNNTLNTRVAITKIEKIEDVPTQCIAVDNDSHLFLAGDYIITHNTGVRGFKKYGQRPQIAILDDLMSDKSAESKTITKDIENVIYKAVRQAMHPTKRKVIWIGTPFNKKDPLYKAAGTTAWTTKAYPICSKFPCTKKDFIGAWEDRFPYEAVKNEYNILKENGKVDAFNQELMLRILSDDDRLVLDEDIVWYSRKDVLNNISKYNIYITTDFATSETEKSDFSVISVWALDYKGVFHWVDGIVKRQDMANNVDDIFRFVKLYNPLSTGIEISGQQKGFVSWLKREMAIRGIYFYIASDKNSGEEGLRPNTSKLTRFNVALPLFKQRKIAFPEELKDSDIMLEFMDEITSVTPGGFKSAHDDCADTISQLPLIEYFAPIDPKYMVSENTTQTNFGRGNYFFTEPVEEYNNSYIV